MKLHICAITALLSVNLLCGCSVEVQTEENTTPERSVVTVQVTEPKETETPEIESNTPSDEVSETTIVPENPTFDEGYPVVDDSYVEYHFRNQKYLNEHFEKHGSEFDDTFNYQTAEEYEKGASDVINDDDALFKHEAEDGDEVYYIEDTNEFVILSQDGYIRTYFRPTAGKKYFDRQ